MERSRFGSSGPKSWELETATVLSTLALMSRPTSSVAPESPSTRNTGVAPMDTSAPGDDSVPRGLPPSQLQNLSAPPVAPSASPKLAPRQTSSARRKRVQQRTTADEDTIPLRDLVSNASRKRASVKHNLKKRQRASATQTSSRSRSRSNSPDDVSTSSEVKTDSPSHTSDAVNPKCSSFLLRFQEILAQPAFKDIISWSPTGDSVIVHDRKALTDLVFPQYFKATLYASFVRQLNMYAFHKVGPNSWRHPFFQRDKRDLLSRIERKGSKASTAGSAASPTPAVKEEPPSPLLTTATPASPALSASQEHTRGFSHSASRSPSLAPSSTSSEPPSPLVSPSLSNAISLQALSGPTTLATLQSLPISTLFGVGPTAAGATPSRSPPLTRARLSASGRNVIPLPAPPGSSSPAMPSIPGPPSGDPVVVKTEPVTPTSSSANAAAVRPPLGASLFGSAASSGSSVPQSPATSVTDGPSGVGAGSAFRLPPFLTRLYEIVDDPSTNHIIRWTDDGLSFKVIDKTSLEQAVLLNYFKHASFASFTRQLNMYAFAKSGFQQWTNSNFIRGARDLLANIVRKRPRSQAASQAAQASLADLQKLQTTYEKERIVRLRVEETVQRISSELLSARSELTNTRTKLVTVESQLQNTRQELDKERSKAFGFEQTVQRLCAQLAAFQVKDANTETSESQASSTSSTAKRTCKCSHSSRSSSTTSAPVTRKNSVPVAVPVPVLLPHSSRQSLMAICTSCGAEVVKDRASVSAPRAVHSRPQMPNIALPSPSLSRQASGQMPTLSPVSPASVAAMSPATPRPLTLVPLPPPPSHPPSHSPLPNALPSSILPPPAPSSSLHSAAMSTFTAQHTAGATAAATLSLAMISSTAAVQTQATLATSRAQAQALMSNPMQSCGVASSTASRMKYRARMLEQRS